MTYHTEEFAMFLCFCIARIEINSDICHVFIQRPGEGGCKSPSAVRTLQAYRLGSAAVFHFVSAFLTFHDLCLLPGMYFESAWFWIIWKQYAGCLLAPAAKHVTLSEPWIIGGLLVIKVLYSVLLGTRHRHVLSVCINIRVILQIL